MFSEGVWKKWYSGAYWNAYWKQREQLNSKTKLKSKTVNEILHWVVWQKLGILKSAKKKDECDS